MLICLIRFACWENSDVPASWAFGYLQGHSPLDGQTGDFQHLQEQLTQHTHLHSECLGADFTQGKNNAGR